MDTIIVLVIVGLAVVYLVRRFARAVRPDTDTDCGCGCSACPQETNCSSEAAPISIGPDAKRPH